MKTGLRHALIFIALAAPAGLLADPCSPTDIVLNSTTDGTLSTTDCSLTGHPVDYYRFSAVAGTNVTASVIGKQFDDLVLTIQDVTGAKLVRDEAAISPSVQLKIPTDGFYIIQIVSADPTNLIGPYKLTLTGVKIPNGCSTDTDPTTLCVGSDRFKIQVAWAALHEGTQGNGTAISQTVDTGAFWFFSSTNLELVIKVLDARTINNHFWVFYGALTNVEYTITITDTLTGAVKTYSNPQDTQASVSDTAAF